MLLIAFTNGTKNPAESAVLAEILPWIDALHIRRDVELPVSEWKETIESLDANARHKLWLHDHFELAVEYQLGGVHISRRTLEHNKGLGVYAAIHHLAASISCHDLADFKNAAELYERVFICPVFDSISKKDHQSTMDHQKISQALTNEREAEIIALGGISLDNFNNARQLGFDGVAVLGSLWNDEDPVAYIKKLHYQCETKHVN